jgi:dCTP deaminase
MIVPFRTDGDGATVVGTSAAFDAAGGLGGNAVLIRPLDAQQLAPESGNSNVSYDLRVGDQYRDHRERGAQRLSEGQKLRLLPGMAVIFETLEEVHLPLRMFGLVVPKVSLGQSGVTVTGSKVDPGYHGHLLITTFNLGKETITLKHGDVIGSLCLMRVEEGGRAYEKSAKHLSGAPSANFWRKLQYHLEAHTGAWMVVVSILTAVLIVLQAAALIRDAREAKGAGIVQPVSSADSARNTPRNRPPS